VHALVFMLIFFFQSNNCGGVCSLSCYFFYFLSVVSLMANHFYFATLKLEV